MRLLLVILAEGCARGPTRQAQVPGWNQPGRARIDIDIASHLLVVTNPSWLRYFPPGITLSLGARVGPASRPFGGICGRGHWIDQKRERELQRIGVQCFIIVLYYLSPVSSSSVFTSFQCAVSGIPDALMCTVH